MIQSTRVRSENNIFEFISKFMSFTDEEIKVISDLDVLKPFKKGTILLEEGALSTNGYFVLKGCLRSFYMVEGEERTTAFYTEFEVINPYCIISGQPSKYYISCVEESILLVTNPAIKRELFKRLPRFESLYNLLSEQLLAKSQTSFDEFKISTPEQRYLNLRKTRPDLIQRIPQNQIASYLGITPPSLSRLRGRIVDKKVIYCSIS